MHNGDRISASEKLEQYIGLVGGDLRGYIHSKFYDQGEEFVDEVTSHTWLKAYEAGPQINATNERQLMAWLKITAYHSAVDLLQDDRQLDEWASKQDDSGEDEDVPYEERLAEAKQLWREAGHGQRPTESAFFFRDEVAHALQRLTPVQQKVWLMCLYGYSKTEIALSLEISNPRVAEIVKQIKARNVRIGI